MMTEQEKENLEIKKVELLEELVKISRKQLVILNSMNMDRLSMQNDIQDMMSDISRIANTITSVIKSLILFQIHKSLPYQIFGRLLS